MRASVMPREALRLLKIEHQAVNQLIHDLTDESNDLARIQFAMVCIATNSVRLKICWRIWFAMKSMRLRR